MTPAVIGIILILFGIMHIVRPDVFRRLMSGKIAFNPQRYSRKQHNFYMRLLGIFLIVIGVFLIIAKYR